MLGGYFFNPVYRVERPDDSLALKVSKNKAFFESSFTITMESPLSEQEQLQTVLGVPHDDAAGTGTRVSDF